MELNKEWTCSGDKGLSVVISRRVGELPEINEGSNWGIFRMQLTLELILRKMTFLMEKREDEV